jgi:hypothetical protein
VTVITPRNPPGESPEDDPTGVRALLSSLPEPDPMPAYLVERISASLAAEQASRSRAGTSTVSPLVRRHRSARRLVLGLAGVAAAAAVVGLVGTDLLRGSNQSAGNATASMATAERSATPGPALAPQTPAQGGTEGVTPMPAMHIQMSSTRYTAAGFAAQAGALAFTPGQRVQPLTGESVGPIATPTGLAGCLRALGVGPVDEVTADLGYYEGVPAAVIVTVTGSTRTAYAVGRSCSTGNQAVLHAGVPVS